MDIICGNEKANSGIYEDGDYWVSIRAGRELQRIAKLKFPFWPLSAVTKYDMIPINKKRLNELQKECAKKLKG